MTGADMVTRQIPAGSKNVRQARPMPATAAMGAALLTMAHRDERTPCQGWDSELWTSDDHEVRAVVIPLCTSCDLLTLCAQYGDEIKATAAVYGGTDRTATTRKAKTA